MSWIDKHEPPKEDMQLKRCDGKEPWHHDPHEWYERGHKDVSVATYNLHTLVRSKVEFVTWNWCEGYTS